MERSCPLRREVRKPAWGQRIAICVATSVTLLVISAALATMIFSPSEGIKEDATEALRLPASRLAAPAPRAIQRTISSSAFDAGSPRRDREFLLAFDVAESVFVEFPAAKTPAPWHSFGRPLSLLAEKEAASLELQGEEIPPEIRARIGQRLRLGETCTGVVADIHLVWRVRGDLERVTGERLAEDPKRQVRHIAELGVPTYAGRIIGCDDAPATYARAEAAEALHIGSRESLGAAALPVVQEAERKFRASDAVAKTQADYLTFLRGEHEQAEERHWLRPGEVRRDAFFLPDGSGILVLHARSDEHCPLFEGGAWAFFEIERLATGPNPPIRLGSMLAARAELTLYVAGAVDVDGDGRLDVDGGFGFHGRKVYSSGGKTLGTSRSPMLGCRY